jgi:hypothetical protein
MLVAELRLYNNRQFHDFHPNLPCVMLFLLMDQMNTCFYDLAF